MNKIEQTRQRLIKAGRKIFNLSSGNPNEFGIFFDDTILAAAYKKFLKTPAYEPDPKGSMPAREAVQKFYADRGMKISPEQIILTSGSSESYFHLFKMLAIPGEKILFPKPSYPLFEEIARLAEVEIAFYKLDENDGWQIDCENLESKIRDDVKAIVLISPGNPTGAVLSEKNLRRVAEIAVKHNLPIISDEVFSEYIFDETSPANGARKSPSVKQFPRMAEIARALQRGAGEHRRAPTVFTLNGLSKTYALPGLKLSWIAVTGPVKSTQIRLQKSGQLQKSTSKVGATSKVEPVHYLDQLERSADAFLSTNQISQAMAPDIIKKGQPFIKKLNRHLQKNRDRAVKILGQNPNITFHIPEGGFYLFARISGRGGSWLRTVGAGGMKSAEGNRGMKLFNDGKASASQTATHGNKPCGLCRGPVLPEDGFIPAAKLTDEDFVIALMEKTGIFAHPGYFYDYDKGIYILISLLAPVEVLTQKLKILCAAIDSPG